VIKEAFTDMLFSADEVRNGDLAGQLFKKIRERYV